MSTRLEKLQAMLDRDPTAAFPLYGMAMELKSLGRPEEAEKVFARLIEHHPGYTAAFLHYGTTLQEMGLRERAEMIFQRGIRTASEQGDEKARRELEEALDLL